jgi:hypothetical protein
VDGDIADFVALAFVDLEGDCDAAFDLLLVDVDSDVDEALVLVKLAECLGVVLELLVIETARLCEETPESGFLCFNNVLKCGCFLRSVSFKAEGFD